MWKILWCDLQISCICIFDGMSDDLVKWHSRFCIICNRKWAGGFVAAGLCLLKQFDESKYYIIVWSRTHWFQMENLLAYAGYWSNQLYGICIWTNHWCKLNRKPPIAFIPYIVQSHCLGLSSRRAHCIVTRKYFEKFILVKIGTRLISK